MGRSRILLVLVCAVATCHADGQTTSDSGRNVVGRGTINVVVADSKGIVVLTDSMVTEVSPDEHGNLELRQLPTPARKLFQIDDFTVCTIAGFGYATTPPVPDFLNDASAIMGRVERQLADYRQVSDARPFRVADKLNLLEGLFGYYIAGVANIRGSEMYHEGNYEFEALIAGYDPDGTAQIGKLHMKLAPGSGNAANLYSAVTVEHTVEPVGRYHEPLVAGVEETARQIQNHPDAWRSDQGVADYAKAKNSKEPPTIEQMKAYAIALKQHTAERYSVVGGANQIAILRHVVSPLRCYASQIGTRCSKPLGMRTILKLPALFQIDL